MSISTAARPARVLVPRVVGLRYKQAEARLGSAGIRSVVLYEDANGTPSTDGPSDPSACEVTEQDDAGKPVRRGAVIGLLLKCSHRNSAPAPGHHRDEPRQAHPLEAGYHGLGASVAAFKAGNNTRQTPQPVPGVAVYRLDATNLAGRVVGYTVRIDAHPPLGNRERMGLTAGINLPSDARIVTENAQCITWRSKTLESVLGLPYAEATTATGTDEASIAAVRSPSC